jgi:Amt family ammonium transporter
MGGGLTVLCFKKYISGVDKDSKLDIAAVVNGMLAGLVGVTASCFAVEPWAAIVIGIICGI